MKKKSLEYKVFMELLHYPDYNPSQMAAHLNLNYNTVRAIYSRLCNQGFLKRERRGRYSLTIPHILFDLYSKIDELRGE